MPPQKAILSVSKLDGRFFFRRLDDDHGEKACHIVLIAEQAVAQGVEFFHIPQA